jgi:flagellin
MSLRINHNIQSVNGHRNMIRNDANISKSLEKLSSGLRINKAADDAAGLVISEQMRAQVTGLGQAIENSEAAVSMVQTAEGALDEMNALLLKARELALHAANVGVNDSNQLTADQNELDNIIDSITRIGNNTQFGTKKLLDGTLAAGQSNTGSITSFKPVGMTNGNYTVTVTSGVIGHISNIVSAGDAASLTNVTLSASMAAGALWDAATTLTVASVSVTVAAGTTVQSGMDALNTALSTANKGVALTLDVSSGTAGYFELTATEVGSYSDGYSLTITSSTGDFTGSAMADGADVAIANINGQAFTVDGNRGLSLTSAAGSTLTLAANTGATLTNGVTVRDGAVFQVGGNQGQTVNLSIDAVRAQDLGLGVVTGKSLNSLASENFLTGGFTQNAITIIDEAIDNVTNIRGKLGAFQSDILESGLNNLRVTHENLVAAESTIRDVDFAGESANFTRNSILIQSATAMLAQANQLPQNVLQLLQG